MELRVNRGGVLVCLRLALHATENGDAQDGTIPFYIERFSIYLYWKKNDTDARRRLLRKSTPPPLTEKLK
jgi:hypothetical protein